MLPASTALAPRAPHLTLCQPQASKLMGTEGLSSSLSVEAAADLPSFDVLYEELLPFVWRCARKMGVAPESLEDVCQEVFLVVCRRLPEWQRRSSLRTWAFGILQNVVRNHRRSLSRKRASALGEAIDPDGLESATPRPEEQVALTQAELLLQRLLSELDETRRDVFILSEIEELPLAEVAVALGLSQTTALSRLRSAREDFAAAARRARARDEWRLG